MLIASFVFGFIALFVFCFIASSVDTFLAVYFASELRQYFVMFVFNKCLEKKNIIGEREILKMVGFALLLKTETWKLKSRWYIIIQLVTFGFSIIFIESSCTSVPVI